MRDMGIRIRPMIADDVGPLADGIVADHWGERRSWFDFVVGHAACRPLVAVDDDGRQLGSAVATVNGPVAWIGTIWVVPDRRREGIGERLTAAVLDVAEDAGCRTSVLVATEVGRPLYEKLGFELQTSIVVVEAPGTGADASGVAVAAPPDPRVRPFRPDDLDAMARLDLAATGEDRRHLLRAFATGASATVHDDPVSGIGGFVVRATWGGGATIAPDPDVALALLEARRRRTGADRHVRAGVLAENTTGIARLVQAGWTEAWRAPRLVRGDPLSWQPEAIWGQFNHAVG
jgi:GNAT superfamily N-acetyltransferase